MSRRLHELAAERGRTRTPDPAAQAGGTEPVTLRYTAKQLHGDLARGLIGLVLTAGPLIAVRPLLVVAILLGLCAAIFAVYLARTVMRYRTTILLDGWGLRRRGLGRLPGGLGDADIAWAALDSVKMRYYSTKRGRDGAGWLVLTLTGRADDSPSNRASAKISVESTLQDFDHLLARTAEAIEARGLSPDETTAHNFTAAGRPIGRPGGPDGPDGDNAGRQGPADGINGEDRAP